MKLPKLGTVVCITWIDSSHSDTWEYVPPGEKPTFKLRENRTYGELTAIQEQSITVSSTVGEGQDNTAHLCPLAIPLGCILSVEELKCKL